jgi:hypothetical protein
MPQDERGFLIVPHEIATGADCDGCLIGVGRGDMVEIKCGTGIAPASAKGVWL